MAFDVEEYARKRKQNESTNSEGNGNSRFDVEDYVKRKNLSKVGEYLSSSINTWLERNESFVNSYNTRYASETPTYKEGQKWLSSIETKKYEAEQLKKEAAEIRSYLDEYKDYLGKDYYSFVNALDGNLKTQGDILTATNSDLEYWSKWDSEEAYNKAIKEQEEAQKTYEGYVSFDLEAGKLEIEALEKELAEWKIPENEARGIEAAEKMIADLRKRNSELEIWRAKGHQPAIDEYKKNEETIAFYTGKIKEVYAEREELSSTISQKQMYYTNAERVQKGIELASVSDPKSENYDPAFAQKAQYQSTEFKAENFWDKFHATEYDLGYDDLTHQYINGDEDFRAEVRRKHSIYSSDNPYDDGKSRFEEAAYDFMEKDEIAIYNYYYNTEGKAKAEEYLDSIAETLNYRKALEKFAGLEGKVFAEYVYGVEAGLDQFETGIESLFSNEDYIPTSATQYASGMVREDLADNGAKLPDWLGGKDGTTWGQVGYDAITTTSNMLPSILVSFVPVVGQTASAFTLGASAAGNAKAEMLRLGYSKEQATTYGVMVGVTEVAMEKLLGSIPGLSNGSGLFSTLSNKAISKIDNALARVSMTIGGNSKVLAALAKVGLKTAKGVVNLAGDALDEALEEGLQTIIEPWLAEAATNVDWDDPTIDEVLYSSLLGAISSIGLSGGVNSLGSVADAVDRKAQYNQMVEQHGQSIIDKGGEDLVMKLAKDMAGVTEKSDSKKLTKLAGKVESKASAKNVGKLSAQVENSIVKQNRSDIQQALIEKGLSQKDAKRVSEYLVSSKALTKEQKAEIESNKNIKAVYDELLDNRNSTISERGRQLVAARLGTKLNAENSGELSLKNDVDIKERISETGKTTLADTGEEVTIDKSNPIAKVKYVDGERVVYYNTDHGTVEASNVKYASEEEGLLYEAFTDMNPAFANAVIKNYDGSVPVQTYINGMREGMILYGMHNFEAVGKDIPKNTFLADLSEADQAFALKLGKAYAKADAKKANKDLRSAIKKAAERAEASKGASTSEATQNKAKKGNVYFEEGAKEQTHKQHKRIVSLAKHLAKAIGIDIVFYDSRLTGKKAGQGANGFYDADTDTIYLDLQNAHDDAKTIAYTLSHELVHFIKKWSPQKFNTFAEFLLDQYAAHGVSAANLLKKKMAELNTTDADLAYEEMIADACETMLLDSNAMVKLMELRKSDLELFEKIKLHILKILNDIREAYKKLGYQPSSDEAKALLGMKDVLEKFYSMFEEAAVDATKNYQALGTEGYNELVAKTTETGVKHQLKAHNVEINESMTMEQAKQMIQRAFVLRGIKEWYDGEYKNGDEWARAQGADEVAMYVENEYQLQELYINKIPGILEDRFFVSDVIEAYLKGTLTGQVKQKAQKLNLTNSVKVADPRFYAPQAIADAKALYEVANQRVNDKNRAEVYEARAKILLYAHNKGAAETLGITVSDLNKKLRSWSNYSSKAKDASIRINKDVEESNRWTGIENMSYISKATVSAEEVVRMVKAIEGKSDDFQNRYIARTMLALDTHIDWSWLTFKFDTVQGVNESMVGSGRANGYYRDSSRLIHCKKDAPNTVAHEMGHALDHQWGRDLGLGSSALTEAYRNTDRVSGDVKIWFEQFKNFADDLAESASLHSEYTMDIKEVFARFVAKFVEWTETIATGRSSGYETSYYNDKFTTAQFVEFARILQGKAVLDANGLTANKVGADSSSTQDETVYKKQAKRVLGDYSKPITISDVAALRAISDKRGQVSINDLTSDEIEILQKWAYKYWNDPKIRTKSPFFRAWFGEWRAHDIKKKTIISFTPSYSKEQVEKNRGDAVINDVGWTVAISGHGERNTNAHSGDEKRSLHGLTNIRDLLQNSILFDTELHEHHNNNAKNDLIAFDHKLYSLGIDKEGVVSLYKITVEEYFQDWKHPDAKRFHNLRYVEKIAEIPTKKVAENPEGRQDFDESRAVSFSENLATKYSLADLYNFVKRFDKDFTPAPEISPMVAKYLLNEDATPRMFDHTTEDGRPIKVFKNDAGQIKSAETGIDANIGTFDGNNSNIHYQQKHTQGNVGYHAGDLGKAEFLFQQGSSRGTRLDNVEYGSVIYDLKKDTVLYQKKKTSNRTILANALETTAQNDIEKNKLSQYKEKIALIESEEEKLAELRGKIKELSFAKGARDTAAIKKLQFEAKQAENRINTYDRQLLNLESTTALKGVLEREKQKAYQRAEMKGKEKLDAYREKMTKTQRELLTRYQDSRKKGIESRNKTEMRGKIKKVVGELNALLLDSTKDKHVPIGLQKPVAEALDIINMDSVGADERVAKYNALIAKAKDPDIITELTKSRDRIALQGENLSDKLNALKSAYAEIKNSDDPLIKGSHDESIETLIHNTAITVGATSLRDMSYEQLEAVYDMYKAILAKVRNANKMFKAEKQETITANSEWAKREVSAVGGHRNRVLKATKFLKKFGWNMLKPIYAMKLIGSDTLTRLYENVRKGEDVWAVDVNEAKDFFHEMKEKYEYNTWDFEKPYKFTDSAGHSFSLTLEQIMSLYAYSKRSQADKHLEIGGFIFDDAIEVTEKNKLGIPMKYEVNDANPYRLKKEDLGKIISILETDLNNVKKFVDEMQTYLSDVMGAKGNEVSLAMYDIKLYKEKNYFPLKSAKYFREFDPEKNGTPKIKNSGFSKKTVPQAGNPIVLSNFMDVWANHVNDMSMYHAFVLPLEDFMRVYNYSSTAGGYDSVQQYIKNAYGAQANTYIETLMNDLNGGARTDPATDLIGKGMSLFKKAAVFASASVVIQQPSAIARATAYIDTKYFIDKPEATKHKETWAEVKKYAPVAIIKEMGYFDTNMGRSTVDWIRDEKTWRDKVDDLASKAPALADELAWCAIWKAVKREVADSTNLKVDSEEFLKIAGKRFTEVVTKTQVYDSVLSRSALMRSKDTGAKMITAFMAEPTTSLNMVVDAIIEGKRGNKKFAKKVYGAVAASIILNSILVSLVTAARDDDDDETYAEKYLESLTAELIDGFNPLTYIPLIKDIWSIMQGYDIERSDMSIWSDLWQSVENLFSDNKSGFEKTEGIVGSIASIFGLPVKNLMRDARAVYNLASTLLSGTPTTSAGVRDAVIGAVKNSIPLVSRIAKAESKGEKLYDAIAKGDSAHTERLKNGYKDEDAANTAIRKAIGEMYKSGEIDYSEAMDALINYGGYDRDKAYWKLQEWDFGIENDEDEDAEYSKYAKFYEAVRTGSNLKAVITEYTNHGVETKTLASQITSYYKPLYKNMSNAERASIKGYLLNAYALLGYNRYEKSKDIDKWLTEKD